MKALLITALFMEFISVNTASAAEEIQQGVVREFIDNSQPPLSEVNQEKFNNIKKALSEAK